MSIVKTKETIETGLSKADESYIFIARKADASSVNLGKNYWKNGKRIEWSKYQIKMSDMRSMTASFTTNQYLDLTTGQYTVLIVSPYHIGFGGVIIMVDYDDKTDIYTYQCQDFSRMYQSKVDLVANNISVHRILQYLITKGAVNLKGDVSSKLKKYKRLLSGLRPASHYWEPAWGGSVDNNPMTIKKKLIIRNKSFIEAIRDLVYGYGQYIDVYFDKYGIIHIEPYVKSEWLNTGLILTMPEIASLSPKFDITNVITGVTVHNTNKLKTGTDYESSSLVNLDLSAFFGDLRTSIDNPNTSTGASNSSSKNKTSTKTSKNKTKNNNIYNTKKKIVYLNTDSITSYSSDMKRMEDMKKILKKNGWEVHIAGVGSEAHYKKRNEVKKGIWFCLYGGLCAGTLKEHCTSSWFLNPLKKNKSRVVVGFFPPSGNFRKGGKYYKHLGPAWDWQNGGNPNINYPAKYLSKHGIPWMYASNAKEMASKFLAGGDNYKTEGNSYKYYDSWQKHKLKWL